MIKIRTLFSGIGSPEKAFSDLGIQYEVVDFCEIDKYAIKSYCAIHGVDESKNLGDISRVDESKLPYSDMLIWGFPCQDISVAGKGEGIIENKTRSGMYYEGFRVLKKTMPKYSIIENVKNLVGSKFRHDFEKMLKDIEELGYNNYWKVLNSKDFDVPQNRERVFIVSIRKDVDNGTFEFPAGGDSGIRLKDVLDDEVDESFYLSQEKYDNVTSNLNDKNSLLLDMCQAKREGKPREYTEYSPTLAARDYKEPRIINCHNEKRIRKLTPNECFRLMGFTDSDFLKCKNMGISNSQLYKQAGNSIVTKVVAAIIESLLKAQGVIVCLKTQQ